MLIALKFRFKLILIIPTFPFSIILRAAHVLLKIERITLTPLQNRESSVSFFSMKDLFSLKEHAGLLSDVDLLQLNYGMPSQIFISLGFKGCTHTC